jgi:hypothetical protein
MRTLSLVLTAAIGWAAPAALADRPQPSDATLGLKPPSDAAVLLDDDLDSWVKGDGQTPADWTVEDGVATVGKGSIKTKDKFGDFQLHVEFNVPYMPDKKGQARGNSGVYLDGTYELQVLDSYGLPPKNNECGAIYTQAVPSVNACKPPLQWQTYDVTFRKARKEGDKVVQKARVTVVQNGIKIIDDVEVGTTPGGVGTREGEDGPLMLQDHGNKVQYRNIWIKPL